MVYTKNVSQSYMGINNGGLWTTFTYAKETD